MPQLTESAAEKLSPQQATAIVRVLDQEARWDSLLGKKTTDTSSLRARQLANDAFQSAMREYIAKFGNAQIPEPTHAIPDRLAVWCRVLRVVFQRAESGSQVEVMAKVYRLADRIAARLGKETVVRNTTNDLAGAVRELDIVIGWCGGLVPTTTPQISATVPKLVNEEAA